MDCKGRMLAASNKVQTIFAEPRTLKEPKDTSTQLASIINIGAHDICRLITDSGNPGFAKIKVGADVNECQAVSKISGIGVQTEWERYYPCGNLACHIVGFTSADNRGLEGIELQYDKELSGASAQDIFFADAIRRPIRMKQKSGVLKDGVGIILTIDAAIQQFVREELLKQYKEFQAESAIAIVADPKTGAILAMVSLPDYNPDQASEIKTDRLKNRALNDQFEPGSILKPFAAAIALDCGKVSLNTVINCEYGSYRGKGFGRIGEYGNHRYGNLTVREILIHSSNIGMAKIGQMLGKEKLYKGMKLFGFGQKTGIDMPGEEEGRLWPLSRWTGYSVTRVPFGQEITVTGIQLIQAFCILSNGGYAVKPYMVKAVVDSNGAIIKLKQNPSAVGFILKPETANKIVTDALVGVVTDGTGKGAALKKWQVYGKTGTANIAKTTQKGFSDSDYVASFIGGAPAKKPEVVVLVSVRKPNKKLGKGYTGGTVAAPVAGRILEKTLSYLEK